MFSSALTIDQGMGVVAFESFVDFVGIREVVK